MQWIHIVYFITAVAAVIASEEDPRSKRDLSLLTKLLSAKEHHHKTRVYHVQSVDNYIVKAVPKVTTTVETGTHKITQDNDVVDKHKPVAVLGSDLTDTQNESYFAVQGEQNMLETGVFRPQKPVDKIVETASVDASQLAFGAGVQNHDHISSTLHQHPALLYTNVKPVLQDCDEVIKVPVPSIAQPMHYSYKQIHNDGLTTYTSKDSKNVIVTDTRVPPPLPHYLNNRFEDILTLKYTKQPEVSLPHVHVTHPLLHFNRHIAHGSHQSAYAGHYPTHVAHLYPSTQVSYPSNLRVEYPLSHGTHTLQHVSHKSAPGVHQLINGIHHAAHNPQYYDGNQSVDIYQPSIRVLHPSLHNHHLIYPEMYVDQTPVHVTPPSVKILSAHSYQPTIHEHENYLTSVHASQPLLHVTEPSLHIVKAPEMSINDIPESVNPVSSGYSYKHLHNDGKVTSYFGSGIVQQHQQDKPINSEVNVEAGVYNTHGTVSSTPLSVFSYKNIHQDGRVTDYSQSDNDNKYIKSTLLVQNVVEPQDLSSLVAGRSENVAGTAFSKPSSNGVRVENDFDIGNIYLGTGSPQVYDAKQMQQGNVRVTNTQKNINIIGSQNENKQSIMQDTLKSQYRYRKVNQYTPDQFISGGLSDANKETIQGHAELGIVSENGMNTAPLLINAEYANNGAYSSTYGTLSTENSDGISDMIEKSSGSAIFDKDFAISSTQKPYDESFSANPIVVIPEKPRFSYTQNRFDGSSMTVSSNKENMVSVTEVNALQNRGRGDIPEEAV